MNPYIQYMYSYPHKTAYRPLEGIFLKDYASCLAGRGHGLYLHIPFCQTKCGYCNLFSVTGQGEEKIDRYLDGVERQLTQFRDILEPYGAEFGDVTIGGGTPLLLTEKQLDRMFQLVDSGLSLVRNRDLIIETAPNQTTKEKLKLLKSAGVTRISMGIQSFHDGELKTLQRQHHAGKAREALDLLRSFSFPCVNLDFIYGIPGQTIGSLLDSLEEALTFQPDELFLYPLYVKHGAGLERKLQNEGLVLDPELAFQQYQEASAFLRSFGFRQDSMRRFVRRPDRRAFSDCGFGTSLALGCGGRSYLGKLHFCTPYAITQKGCLSQLRAFEQTEDFNVITHGILLSEEEIRRRFVIRHLLIQPGLSLKTYYDHFNSDAEHDFPQLAYWLQQGWLRKEVFPAGELDLGAETMLTLTDTGMGLCDYLGPQLISQEIQGRMDEWEERNL
ncbi:MAG: STM4012 family radical SAM protein [Lachnospiraceae bacterium]|nr:STM4012 family radical SAM protein [Lachnospiraceae bacterium]